MVEIGNLVEEACGRHWAPSNKPEFNPNGGEVPEPKKKRGWGVAGDGDGDKDKEKRKEKKMTWFVYLKRLRTFGVINVANDIWREVIHNQNN